MDEKAQLLIGPDEKVPTGEAVLLGLQHVLAWTFMFRQLFLVDYWQWGQLIPQDYFKQRF